MGDGYADCWVRDEEKRDDEARHPKGKRLGVLEHKEQKKKKDGRTTQLGIV